MARTADRAAVVIGLENCLVSPPKILERAARFGLLLNQASVNRDFEYASTLLARRLPGKLAALFSPQHGGADDGALRVGAVIILTSLQSDLAVNSLDAGGARAHQLVFFIIVPGQKVADGPARPHAEKSYQR